MDNKYYKLLYDVSECIRKIDEFVGQPRLFESYLNNVMLQNAVERNLEIIGEATKRLLELYPDIKITNARKIVDTRNRISHGYDDIENTEIWNIIINHLPVLKNEVEKLLNDD